MMKAVEVRYLRYPGGLLERPLIEGNIIMVEVLLDDDVYQPFVVNLLPSQANIRWLFAKLC
jgi:hypothetical protein